MRLLILIVLIANSFMLFNMMVDIHRVALLLPQISVTQD